MRALRHRSGGQTRSIHVGFPRISPGHFDLVIATPQYPIPDHPKLLRVPYALTRTATTAGELSDKERLEALPRPRALLIVGGPTFFWDPDDRRLLRTLSEMLDEAEARGGSVIVTSSPRTPKAVRAQIEHRLASSTVPSLLASPGEPPSYASLLDAADSIRVTADSVAMASDAIWSGKPMAIVPIAKSFWGRIAMPIADRLRLRLYPQDLRQFWGALAKIGLGGKLARPRASTSDEMRVILARVNPILDEIR